MTTAAKLRVRRPQLDFSHTPKYWVIDDPQSTHALNILQFGIPSGERFFIDSIRLATPYIKDEALLSDVRAFIGQESVHARMHEKAADHLGLSDIPAIKKQIAFFDSRREHLYRRIDAMPEPLRRRATLAWLSTTLLGEHFTALFADILFDPAKVDWSCVDPEMAEMLHWHAAEEMEHRTLPYDVYYHIGGDYPTRVAPLFPTMWLLAPFLAWITDAVMRLDPDLRRGFSLANYVKAVRARRVPNLVDVLARLPVYFLPGYHPSRLGRDDRPQAWLAANPRSLSRAS
jgi:predicted metal-dependent hydrolase